MDSALTHACCGFAPQSHDQVSLPGHVVMGPLLIITLQATVLVLVPYGTTEDDVHVAIENHSLVARVRGQPPIVKVCAGHCIMMTK